MGSDMRSLYPGVLVAGAIGARLSTVLVAPATTTAAVRTIERVDLSAGFLLICKPPDYRLGDQPPLIVCLHETDTGAAVILDFWRKLKTPLKPILVAPEHHMPGWREADLPCVRATIEHLQRNVSYDQHRVLLTGYSAGGAMAFHLLYAEGFPATAVAATANYVPPSVTAAMVAARRDVPIFYAVGERDINHERMRSSIELLQANGGPLTLLRPDIGHTLDPVIGQQAMDWFLTTTSKHTLDRLSLAAASAHAGKYAESLAVVEPILAQRRWHTPEVISRAEEVLVQSEAPGRQDMAKAERLTAVGESVQALDILRRIENAYGDSRLGQEAKHRRERLAADPKVRSVDDARQAERQEEAGRQALAQAQRLVIERHYEAAKQQCDRIIRTYPGTTAASRARTLLEQLRRAGR